MNDKPDIDAELERSIAKAMAEKTPPPPQRTFPARPGGSLAEQMTVFRSVRSELGDRLRREALQLEHRFRARRTELAADFDIRVSEAVAGIERERDKQLAELVNEFRHQADQVARQLAELRGEQP